MYREKYNIERLRQPELKHYVEVEKPDLACLHNVSNKRNTRQRKHIFISIIMGRP